VSSSREEILEDSIRRLEQENRLLRQKLDLLLRRMHGPSSEKLSAEQLDLLTGSEAELGKPAGDAAKESEEASVAPKPEKPRRKRSQPRIPEHLPVAIREVLEPQAVLECREKWRRIGEEISEQLDYEPARFVRRQLVRPKYVSVDNRNEAPIIAPLPNRWTERCLATPALQAHITISKYADHLPLYRQEQIYKTRHGVELRRNTMSRWIDYVSESLKLIYVCMAEQLRATDYLQIDETPIKYLQPGAGKALQGYFWAYSNPKGDVLFDWQTSRGHECLLNMLNPITPDQDPKKRIVFRGIAQCDGYSAYKALTAKIEGIKLAGCMAHVRRKFNEALPGAPVQAGWIIRQIQHLYRIEKKLREQKAGERLRESVRSSESRPIMERIKKALMLFKARASILPQSPLGMAIGYALGEWEELEVFLKEGRVEVDNNYIENAIRPTAIGKKNWMFVGGAETGERSAIIYSIIESCRRHGVDPHEYLNDVLERIPRASNQEIASMTPAAWAKAKAKAEAGARSSAA
jgi:transposase